MVIGNINEAERYYDLHPRMQEVFEFIKKTNFNDYPSGRIELDGDQLFINLDENELEAKADRKLEFHQRYIDVQVPLAIEETFGWAARATMGEPEIAYNTAQDAGFYTRLAQVYVTLQPQQFVIFFPEDTHAPLIGKGKQRKLIAKILIEEK